MEQSELEPISIMNNTHTVIVQLCCITLDFVGSVEYE